MGQEFHAGNVAIRRGVGDPQGESEHHRLGRLTSRIEMITPARSPWRALERDGRVRPSDQRRNRSRGIAYLTALFKNVPVQDDSARKSLATFTSGKGDVLLAYENEAIFAQQNGQDIDYIVPDSTILIENPAAVTTSSKNPEQAKAFFDFVRSPEAQAIFAANGYRPVVDGVDGASDFPTPPGLFTIADLGGWPDVTAKFFDPKGSIMADVEAGIGVSVG